MLKAVSLLTGGSLVAMRLFSALGMWTLALAGYTHAVAGQRLAGEFSSYGVTPSDLPKEIARIIGKVEAGDTF